MYRRRPKDAGPLPEGIRQDTRYRTRHVLRPTKEIVEAYLADPSDAAWHAFVREYLALLSGRFREDRARFDELAPPGRRKRCIPWLQLPDEEEPHRRPLPHVSGPGVHESRNTRTWTSWCPRPRRRSGRGVSCVRRTPNWKSRSLRRRTAACGKRAAMTQQRHRRGREALTRVGVSHRGGSFRSVLRFQRPGPFLGTPSRFLAQAVRAATCRAREAG